jgi:hypothetical protein
MENNIVNFLMTLVFLTKYLYIMNEIEKYE